MRRFSISEISAVDFPAQIHARAEIMKGDNPEPDGTFNKLIEMAKSSAKTEPARTIFKPNRKKMAQLAAEFQKLGFGKEGAKEQPMEQSNFQERVHEIRLRDGCTATQAMSKARQENPTAFADFQQEGREQSELAKRQSRIRPQRSPAERKFFSVVNGLVAEGLSRRAAMVRARKENSALFAEMQNS